MLVRKENRIRLESNNSPDSVELGGYNWTKIGELKGYPVYLCNKSVQYMPFNERSRSNKWKDSDVRKWLNTDFYNSLTPEEKSQIVPFEGDKLFLLSEEEYDKFNGNISRARYWWLRSPGTSSDYATTVDPHGDVIYYVPYYGPIGVRPAVLLNL